MQISSLMKESIDYGGHQQIYKSSWIYSACIPGWQKDTERDNKKCVLF
mgnify:CR=1 FL=1